MSVFEAFFDKIVWAAGKLIVIAGAVILVFAVVLTGFVWRVVWGTWQHRAAEEIRLAACHYVPSVIVEIGDHIVELPTDFSFSGGKETSVDAPWHLTSFRAEKGGFCLEGPQAMPILVSSIGFSKTRGFPKRRPIPGVFLYIARIQRGIYPPRQSPMDLLSDDPEQMVVYEETEARKGYSETKELAMRGRSSDGLRTFARCHAFVPAWKKTEDLTWKCRFTIVDYQNGLTYNLEFAIREHNELDRDWVRDTSLALGRELRQMISALSPEKKEISTTPTSQQDL